MTRARRGAVVCMLAIATLGTTCPDQPNWDLVFERSSVEGSRGWTGGDGAISIPLPGGGTLWIFGDSYVSGWNSATQQRVFGPGLLADVVFGTTIGVQEGASPPDPASIRFYARTGAGEVSDITTGVVGNRIAFFSHAMLGVEPPPGAISLLWPQGGACLSCEDPDPGNDRLAVSLVHLQMCNPQDGGEACMPLCLTGASESCTTGFRFLSHVLARIENPRDPVSEWRASTAHTGPSNVVWGASFVERPDGLYIFGRRDPDMVLARADVDDLLDQDAWSFWDGSGWRPGSLLGTHAPATVAENVGAFFSVDEIARHGIQRFVLVHTHPVMDHFLFVRPSTSLTGWPPLSPKTTRLDLRSIDETLQATIDDDIRNGECDPASAGGVPDYGRCGVSYHGLAHDQISRRDAHGIRRLVFSYIVPVSPSGSAADANYYRPRFGFVPLDRIDPWCNPAQSLCWKGINHQLAPRELGPGEEYREVFDVGGSDSFLALLHTLSGDADLYVRLGEAPTLSEYDCRPGGRGRRPELCQLAAGAATRAHVLVRARDASTFTLRASYDGTQGLAPWHSP